MHLRTGVLGWSLITCVTYHCRAQPRPCFPWTHSHYERSILPSLGHAFDFSLKTRSVGRIKFRYMFCYRTCRTMPTLVDT